MMDEEKKEQPDQKSLPAISRRQFAIGSVAALSGYSLTESYALPALSPEAQEIKLEIDEMTMARMETRHILEDDLKRVIDHAEKTGSKLYQPNSDLFLSKLRVNTVTFYVEYSPAKEGFKVHSAYSCRFKLEGES
jgi:hypothetical protein